MIELKLYTIGFTRKNAEKFFTLLKTNNVKSVLDIRLNNSSQLAGFSKGDDLPFFLKEICNARYEHVLDLAPTKEMLDKYKKEGQDWDTYEKEFVALLEQRGVENLKREKFDGACLLCSEDLPKQCHRRLVAEYLKEKWKEIEIIHLK